MKKKIWLAVLLIVLILVSWLVFSQLDNIRAIMYSMKYSNGEINEMITENDSAVKGQIEEFIGHSVRAFTEEETKQIESGSVTEEEIIEKIVKEEIEKAFSEEPANDVEKTETESETDSPDVKKEEEPKTNYVSMYVSELYSVKGKYLGMLDGMVESAITEYKSLDKKQRTRSKKLEIGASYVKKALSLEKECDQLVSGILTSLEKQLKAEGKDTSIVATLNSAYASEKNLKRAYYLNMFK